MGNIPRTVVSRFALELDGVKCGFVNSAEGGEITADVVVEPTGKKHLAGPRYEELSLAIDLGLARDVYDWIAETWAGTARRRSVVVTEADQTLAERSRREFDDALVTEVSFPPFDAASKDPVQLTVKVAPGSTTTTKGSGAKIAAPVAKQQKRSLASNFRLELDGLDCKRVSKIDAFAVKERGAAEDGGRVRDRGRRETTTEFPNLRVALAEASAQTWVEWFDDFVVKGNNGDDREKNGAIVYLDPTLKELARIELANVGIYALRAPRQAGEQVRRV